MVIDETWKVEKAPELYRQEEKVMLIYKGDEPQMLMKKNGHLQFFRLVVAEEKDFAEIINQKPSI